MKKAADRNKAAPPVKFYIPRDLDLKFDDNADYRLIHAMTRIKQVNGKYYRLNTGDLYNRKAFEKEFISMDDYLKLKEKEKSRQ